MGVIVMSLLLFYRLYWEYELFNVSQRSLGQGGLQMGMMACLFSQTKVIQFLKIYFVPCINLLYLA